MKSSFFCVLFVATIVAFTLAFQSSVLQLAPVKHLANHRRLCFSEKYKLIRNLEISNAESLKQQYKIGRMLPLQMGRAAAVRAATKAKTDSAKAKNNNRFAKKIIMVVKAGGPDPEQNRALAAVIANAKVSNVPNDVIKRNIDKASEKATADYKESVFEFVGRGGVGILVNVLTDNDNRAANDVNLVGKKKNLKPGTKGSVSFNFDRKSRLDVSPGLTEDLLMELCLNAGVDDYDFRSEVDGNPLNPSEEGKTVVFVDMKDMAAIRDALSQAGFQSETSIAAVPKDGAITVSDEDFDANLSAIEAFEELDDVDSVETNMDFVG